MNERIKELLLQSKNQNTGMVDEEKFAELIVRECAELIKVSRDLVYAARWAEAKSKEKNT